MRENPKTTLVLSIARIDGPATGGPQAAHAQSQTCRWLLGQLHHRSLPATWALDEPALWMPTAGDVHTEQEIALLCRTTWSGLKTSRRRFADELARRVTAAASRGISLSTCLIEDTVPREYFDLLAKFGVQAVVALGGSPAPGCSPLPRATRYGIWHIPHAISLPPRRSWWPNTGWLAVHRCIERACVARQFIHLTIDVTVLSTQGPAARRKLDRLFVQVARLDNAGRLAVRTVAGLVRQLAAASQAQATRSILRAA